MDTKFLKSKLKLLKELLETKKGQEGFDFIESLIQKLAQVRIEEMTKEEQSFLICLFIESKITEINSEISILNEYPKKIELMLKIVHVSLLRYYSILNELAYIVVRLNNPELYKRTNSYDMLCDAKPTDDDKYYELLDNVGVDSKTYCVKHSNSFRDSSSDFVFEKLSAVFDIICLGFYSIDTRDLNSLNSLLELLLAFESKFLFEKEKFDVFWRQFKSFQKETEKVLQLIINSHFQYEMRYCGDSAECMKNTPYTEQLADTRRLIETMNAVLSKECQKDCGCHLRTFRRSSPQFPHELIMLTPEMEEQIRRYSAELEELLE